MKINTENIYTINTVMYNARKPAFFFFFFFNYDNYVNPQNGNEIQLDSPVSPWNSRIGSSWTGYQHTASALSQ